MWVSNSLYNCCSLRYNEIRVIAGVIEKSIPSVQILIFLGRKGVLWPYLRTRLWALTLHLYVEKFYSASVAYELHKYFSSFVVVQSKLYRGSNKNRDLYRAINPYVQLKLVVLSLVDGREECLFGS